MTAAASRRDERRGGGDSPPPRRPAPLHRYPPLLRRLTPLWWLGPSVLLIAAIIVYPAIEMIRTSFLEASVYPGGRPPGPPAALRAPRWYFADTPATRRAQGPDSLGR